MTMEMRGPSPDMVALAYTTGPDPATCPATRRPATPKGFRDAGGYPQTPGVDAGADLLEKARQQESDMAEGLNRVMLLGNLGADPELRVTPGGQSVLKLRLATTESCVDKGGTRQERTDWHRITVWGKRGEA